jgi:hypothetical protein
MSVPARLQFALTHVQSSHWSVFEQLASAFAAVDFPALRVLAGVGDEGRDAVLQDAAADSVIIQYSIAEDWKRKIRETVKRLDETGHKCFGQEFLWILGIARTLLPERIIREVSS